MNAANITWIFSFVSGLALFLYGMKLMGDGLEKVAGDKMSSIIDGLTGNLVKGVLVGTAVTAIIQSSGATTVMVIGFINAGLMTLKQAVGVIMGANIGTTTTALILSIGDLNGSLWFLDLLKPTSIAAIAVCIGIFLYIFSKKNRNNNIGEILMGLGILFIGMDMMSDAMGFLKEYDGFDAVMHMFTNPVLGILVGIAVTVLLQSSSASIGVLQASTSVGVIPFSAAVPIILGQNIGACITGLIACIGANKDSKKVATISVLIKVIGAAVFLVVLYVFPVMENIPIEFATKSNIAAFHLLFNVVNTVVLLPFTGVLITVANRIIPSKAGYTEGEANVLDERLLSTPAMALAQANKQVTTMFETAKANFDIVFNVIKGDKMSKRMSTLRDNENFIDEMESSITNYLVKIVDGHINEEENKIISSLFHVITDIERIGDHAKNISQVLEEMESEDLKFSSNAEREIKTMFAATEDILNSAMQAYLNRDLNLALRVQPCEACIDYMKDELRQRHTDRMTKHECTLKSGVLFLDLVNNLERIADHCSNVAVAAEQLINSDVDYDTHTYLKNMHYEKKGDYQAIYDKFLQDYAI